jgi:hypothetical protein
VLSPSLQRSGSCGPLILDSSVADPDPNPDLSDLYVFGPPVSGSESFYHRAKILKIVRKTLIPDVLWLLFDFLSLKNIVNVSSNSNRQKNFFLN